MYKHFEVWYMYVKLSWRPEVDENWAIMVVQPAILTYPTMVFYSYNHLGTFTQRNYDHLGTFIQCNYDNLKTFKRRNYNHLYIVIYNYKKCSTLKGLVLPNYVVKALWQRNLDSRVTIITLSPLHHATTNYIIFCVFKDLLWCSYFHPMCLTNKI